MSETVIQLKNIRKSYGKKEVLSDVNLTINKGDLYGLVGKNGAGKTTLFKIILGLSDYNAGDLYINGNKADLASERSKIGFLIGSNNFGYMTARENLRYYAKLKGITDSSEIDRVLKIVDLYGVKQVASKYSLGMRQRLGIANAMLGNPEILILDEPTNGLDPTGIAEIRELVKKLNEEYGTTIIISSHILGELQNTAHRFGIVNDGTIVKELNEDDLKMVDSVVRLSVDDVERARKVLSENGIAVLDEIHETKSLEDYYFKLIGGREDE